MLRSIDPEQVNAHLLELLTRVRAEKRVQGEQTHVVLDGKTLRGTQDHLAEDQKKMHHMNLYETKTGIVLKQCMVSEKVGELTQMKDFFPPTLLKERIISADALYTQKAFCQEVIASGGDYLLFPKGKQPTLHEDVQLFFREPPLDCFDWRTTCTVDKGHGRLTHRQIQVSTELNAFLAREWYKVGQIFCLRRRVEYSLKWTQEEVYGLTSLTPKQTDPIRLLERIRGHWSIENNLHYRRDVALAEDACQGCKGTTPHALALFDFGGISNTKRYMRCIDVQPLLAVQLLLSL